MSTKPADRPMHAATFLPAVGRANRCVIGTHRPVPLRFVWHHVLPQACGGRTEPANLIQLCDNCHYSIHRIMYGLAHTPIAGGNAAQRGYAQTGYRAAVAAGTADRMPNE